MFENLSLTFGAKPYSFVKLENSLVDFSLSLQYHAYGMMRVGALCVQAKSFTGGYKGARKVAPINQCASQIRLPIGIFRLDLDGFPKLF